MKFCDFFKHFEGRFVFKIYNDDKLIAVRTIDDLNAAYFTGLDIGFWRKTVVKWNVHNNNVTTQHREIVGVFL